MSIPTVLTTVLTLLFAYFLPLGGYFIVKNYPNHRSLFFDTTLMPYFSSMGMDGAEISLVTNGTHFKQVEKEIYYNSYKEKSEYRAHFRTF